MDSHVFLSDSIIHDEIGAQTLFATHYHDLTRLADELDGVCPLYFAADKRDGDVAFLHTVAEGAASASYGIDVARLAGVPESVVERSRDLVATETERRDRDEHTDDSHIDCDSPDSSEDGTDEADIGADIVAELRSLRVAETTPVEALVHLDRLTQQLDDGNH